MPIGIDRDHAMTIPVTGHYLHIIDDNGELIEPRDTVIGYVIYSSPPTARATLPSVSDPSSPKSAASGSSPAPTASSTITHALGGTGLS